DEQTDAGDASVCAVVARLLAVETLSTLNSQFSTRNFSAHSPGKNPVLRSGRDDELDYGAGPRSFAGRRHVFRFASVFACCQRPRFLRTLFPENFLAGRTRRLLSPRRGVACLPDRGGGVISYRGFFFCHSYGSSPALAGSRVVLVSGNVGAGDRVDPGGHAGHG